MVWIPAACGVAAAGPRASARESPREAAARDARSRAHRLGARHRSCSSSRCLASCLARDRSARRPAARSPVACRPRFRRLAVAHQHRSGGYRSRRSASSPLRGPPLLDVPCRSAKRGGTGRMIRVDRRHRLDRVDGRHRAVRRKATSCCTASGGRSMPARVPYGPFVNRNHFATWMIMACPLVFGYLLARAPGRARAPS